MAATLPSNLAAILSSFSVYQAIHRYAHGPNPSPARLTVVSKATSTLHSTVTTILALHFLRRCKEQWADSTTKETRAGRLYGGRYPDESNNSVLQTRSALGNAITALECGYLLQDTLRLLHGARVRHRLLRPGSKATLRSVLPYADKPLLFHHIGITSALLLLHYYIHRGRESGIYIIVQFLLMNGSTPILNMRWWLRTYHPEYRKVGLSSDIAFIAAFYIARVWLVGWILRGYGKAHGYDSAWTVYREAMRLPCRLGTGVLWVGNTAWWALLVTSVFRRLYREWAGVSKLLHGQKM
ncbi:MAG: hypothetical protein L6R40_002623 [Gallowayella cf. fulva]|nr:MAG: hypothetical protein L6R40_002623 [Xanthomendoza cf. fulva]